LRINNPASGRAAYYDRNPATKDMGSQTTVGNHVTTLRFTYTVPSGRKFALGWLQVFLNRFTVATTAAQVFCEITITPSGGAELLMAYVETAVSNLVDTNRMQTVGAGLILLAGDALKGYDSDGSTGGTVTVGEQITGTEFDA